MVDDEHTELRWFAQAAAISLPDLALAEYRPLLQKIIEITPKQLKPLPHIQSVWRPRSRLCQERRSPTDRQ